MPKVAVFKILYEVQTHCLEKFKEQEFEEKNFFYHVALFVAFHTRHGLVNGTLG